jgi:hypothetical protein
MNYSDSSHPFNQYYRVKFHFQVDWQILIVSEILIVKLNMNK